ncbi:MerR family DNA-binding transcriptional regulator [uncultured Jatrophihabitans sp.]|uniref:helix-turn-helix domain-containing protein n=1 Tax=uncultured Jatrophihabitans sp. TaxID=1610747 RepID=UPI0035CA4F33
MTTTADPGAHLSVGEVARLAGVTTRTVRHYHAIGLIPEPARDSAGYRRYGAREVVALVRIVRLRALGMPIPQIAARVGAVPSMSDDLRALPNDLRALADELDREIAQLQTTRDRLRELADSETFDQPVRALTDALRGAGLLGPSDELDEGEESAATLLDALHPKGMSGVLTRANRLLSDPSSNARLMVLLQRFRALDDDTPSDDVTALARDVAQVLPRRRRPNRPAAVDLELMDKLLSGQLNPAQQRFMSQLRQDLGRVAGSAS